MYRMKREGIEVGFDNWCAIVLYAIFSRITITVIQVNIVDLCISTATSRYRCAKGAELNDTPGNASALIPIFLTIGLISI